MVIEVKRTKRKEEKEGGGERRRRRRKEEVMMMARLVRAEREKGKMTPMSQLSSQKFNCTEERLHGHLASPSHYYHAFNQPDLSG